MTRRPGERGGDRGRRTDGQKGTGEIRRATVTAVTGPLDPSLPTEPKDDTRGGSRPEPGIVHESCGHTLTRHSHFPPPPFPVLEGHELLLSLNSFMSKNHEGFYTCSPDPGRLEERGRVGGGQIPQVGVDGSTLRRYRVEE